MKKQQLLALALVIIMFVSMTACAGGGSSNGDTVFTYWISQSADSSYYSDYSENPCIKYLTSKTWGENNATLEFEFVVPAAGEERSNFNTLLATDDYADILTLSHYDGTAQDLYEEGYILDITEYVEQYMPNYLAFLDAHPEYKKTATNKIDGESRYLQLFSYMPGKPDAWSGYSYRRDWIVKYGKNPVDGSAFSGDYAEMNDDGTPNKQTWTDNVVFPSGGSHPVYISDWEWMLEIFEIALEQEGITDGYCMNIYYPGYMETGELVSSFGGGGGHWYENEDGDAAFGVTSDDFRTYLQCMNTWYSNGWIDTAFPEHASDMYYQIDLAKVAQGKVGLWFGTQGQLIGSMDTGMEHTDGMIVYACALPINDIYGTADQQHKDPYTFLTSGGSPVSIAISNKAEDKDLASLFSLLDYMYTEEGSFLATFGLNKEQYEEIQDELYTSYGLTEGAYYPTTVSQDGVQRYAITVTSNATLADAIRCVRFFALDSGEQKDSAPTAAYRECLDQWIVYENTGRFSTTFTNKVTPEDSKVINKVETNIREFMNKNVPNFIKGTKDPFSDADWNAFVNAVNKYGPDQVTEIYQRMLDELN